MRIFKIPVSGEVLLEDVSRVLTPWLTSTDDGDESIQRSAVAATWCAGWISAASALAEGETLTPTEVLRLLADGCEGFEMPEAS